MKLNKLFEELLLELSYRVDEGRPDFKNKKHLTIFKEILMERFDENETVANEIIKNITEADEKPKEDATADPTVPALDDTAETPPATDAPAETPPAETPPAETSPATDAPAETPPATDAPAETPPATDAPAEETPPTTEEPTKEEPKEKPATGNTSSQATINMQNAEKSGMYFYRPNEEYTASPSVEAIYEHPDGTLWLKFGDTELQVNQDPYSGYKAAMKLQPIQKEKGKDSGEYIGVSANHDTDVKPTGDKKEEK